MTLLLCAIQYTTLKSHAEDDIAGDAELRPKFNPHGSQTLIKIHLSSSSISNSSTYFANVTFALVSLGDRSYGLDAFYAGGWKLATRLVQLVGYGDDSNNSGGGGGGGTVRAGGGGGCWPIWMVGWRLNHSQCCNCAATDDDDDDDK